MKKSVLASLIICLAFSGCASLGIGPITDEDIDQAYNTTVRLIELYKDIETQLKPDEPIRYNDLIAMAENRAQANELRDLLDKQLEDAGVNSEIRAVILQAIEDRDEEGLRRALLRILALQADIEKKEEKIEKIVTTR